MDRRHLIAGLVTLVAAAGFAPPASATFHEMKIREVSIGAGGANSADFVELQMYSPGQTQIMGHPIKAFNAAGTQSNTYTPAGPVANGQSQRTILVSNPMGTGLPAPDVDTGGAFTQPTTAGGAVCFDNIDCVAWGNFTGTLPSPVTSSAPAFAAGQALVRKISPGCPTLLEASDDTNAGSDFEVVAMPTPRNNSVTPTETPCNGTPATTDPETQIDKGPKKKIRKSKATFKFSSTGVGATFECALDKKAFKPCTSPHTVKKLKTGKHTFKVVAIDANDNRDESAATQRFKVLKN